MSADVITIVKGAARTFYADLTYPDSDSPVDLTGVTAITASFPADDGTAVSVDMDGGGVTVLGAPGAGRIAISVQEEDTAEMQVDPSPATQQDLQVEVTDMAGDLAIIILPGVLNIVAPSYPIA